MGRVRIEEGRAGDHCTNTSVPEGGNCKGMGEAHDLNCAVPGAGREGVFGYQIPIDREDFPVMFLP